MAGKSHWQLCSNYHSVLTNTSPPPPPAPSLTPAKQQEEGTTGCTQCCSSGTDGTDSNCSQQPNTLAYAQRQYSVEISLSAKPTGGLWLRQAFHCSSTYVDATVEVKGEQKEQNSAQGLLSLPHLILLRHNTTGGHQRMEYVKTKVSCLNASTTGIAPQKEYFSVWT